jgi:alpha-beta hydrolase superfamily lysophospholipase
MQRLKQLTLILLTLFMIASSLLYVLQEKLIFLPTKLEKNYKYSFSAPFDEVFLEANDGAQLNALHFKRREPKGVILYFHGNAGDLSRWGEIALYFVEKNFDVIIMDYRTYGKSTGSLSEEKLFSDAQLFYEYVLKQYAEKDIIVYGRSLGASIATHVASNNRPKKLILETPFYNLLDVAKDRFSLLPVKQLLKYEFASNIYIKKVKIPIAIFHGTEDEVVPYESGRKLYKVLPEVQKNFYTIKNGGHNNLVNFEAFREGIENELNQID